MTYLLISVLKKLPPTPYVKWIEYWLIFAQMVPFIKAVLITSIQWLMENGNKNQTESRKESKEEDLVLIAGKLVWVRKPEYQLFSNNSLLQLEPEESDPKEKTKEPHFPTALQFIGASEEFHLMTCLITQSGPLIF